MPWFYFVCIIQKYDFCVELLSESMGTTVHSSETQRKRDPWFSYPSLKKENLAHKSLQSEAEHNLVCNWACMAPCWFQMCRCKWLWITASGLAENLLTIHLLLRTSQSSCPENHNTNTVSTFRSLILHLPHPYHLQAEFYCICCRIWTAIVWVLRSIMGSSTIWAG